MPFTPAHPAIVLPLQRTLKWTIPSALVIGGMAPDFAYFLYLDLPRAESHSLGGLFWFCLPIGWIAYLTFHLLLKRPLLSLTPEWADRRLSPLLGPTLLPRTHWLAVTGSLLIGAITHFLWDSFTHDGSPGVEAISFLQIQVFAIGTYPFYVYSLLQHASSAAGVSAIVFWLFRWFQSAPVGSSPIPSLRPSQRLVTFAGLFLLPALCGLAVAIPRLSLPLSRKMLENAIGHAVIAVFSTLGLFVFLFTGWWHLTTKADKISATN